jgi:hypothetical protein
LGEKRNSLSMQSAIKSLSAKGGATVVVGDDRFAVVTTLQSPREQASATPRLPFPSDVFDVRVYSDFTGGLVNDAFYIVVF